MKIEKKTKVDFSYAFGTPHRLCISMPEASKKCLLDSSAEGVEISWSDDDLRNIPLGAFYGPKLKWFFNITAEVNGKRVNGASWKRVENRLPALEYVWMNESIQIIMIGASSEKNDIFKFTIKNFVNHANEIGIFGKTKDLSFNTKWMNPSSQYNALLAHYGDRSDRILLFSTEKAEKLRSPSNLDVIINLESGEERIFYFIRPHKKIIDDIDLLLNKNWEQELEDSLNVWRNIINKALKLSIPDKNVEDAYYACFCDIFVARELNSAGEMAGLAGTDLYRCMNTCEPTIAAIVLDHSGLYKESESVMKSILNTQDEKTGRWDDYRMWGHDIGWIPAARCWWIKEHYLFTRDKNFLLSGFAQMYRHIKWVHNERQKTKINNPDGTKPITWGLLPRGMGDGGLMDGDDYFGIFIPSNVWHCFIIKLALWAVKELNLIEKEQEIQYYLDDAVQCTIEAIRKGAINESDGTKWIPGVPGKTSGSRFSATSSIYPCELIDPFDELATGTLNKLESNLSEGGLPKDLGWLKGGLWVAIALDNIAYAHIHRGEYDLASGYLYPVLNHGTPLFTWCEERAPEPGTKIITGDLQHTWTPHILNRFIRDCIIMEKDNNLLLACATPRNWLLPDLTISIEKANTHFGFVSFSLKRVSEKEIHFYYKSESRIKPDNIYLHIRIPEKERNIQIKSFKNCNISKNDKNIFELSKFFNEINVEFDIL